MTFTTIGLEILSLGLLLITKKALQLLIIIIEELNNQI